MLRRRLARLFLGGTDGNERLTANTAAILIVLLAVEAATLLSLRSLLPVHVFVGMLLIPPVALKLASTGYRFLRYYRRAPEYVSKGPPMLLMRMVVAPFVVATTVALFASGVALIVLGPKSDVVLNVHKASFILWAGAISIHVLVYVRRLPPTAPARLDARSRASRGARRRRADGRRPARRRDLSARGPVVRPHAR